MTEARPSHLAVIDRVASFLLGYPDRTVLEGLPEAESALGSLPAWGPRNRLSEFVARASATEPSALEIEYVEAFDFRRRSCLYLTYYTDGDTRRRGMALARLKRRYREAGLVMEGGELPDYLPAVLEYAAITGDRGILAEHRPALELLRLALEESGSPYASVVRAVCDTLPGPTPSDRQAVLALAAAGPPSEEVGLDPYPTSGPGPP